jgi:hypothetical protein
MKCTPWQAAPNGAKTLKAGVTEAFNTYTAWELTYNAYFRTPGGTVEFKYRKDSKSSYLVNGEFKFAINNKEVMTDYKATSTSAMGNSEWNVYRHNITDAGTYTLIWIYSKYSEKGVTEAMASEIEVRYL